MRCHPTQQALENASSAIDVHLFSWKGLAEIKTHHLHECVLLIV
jgi:hypothetical protein